MMKLRGGVLEVTVCDKEEMDQSLNAAVDRMVAAATQHGRQGILITRLGMGHFTVELTDAVPYGYTEELDKAQQLTLKNPLPDFGNNPPNARAKGPE
jgi:hypothetical protein